jgi:hypothetical protein
MQKGLRSDGRATLNVCGCGRLHLTYGPITIHFKPDDFLAFGEAVTQLVEQFRLAQSDRLVPPTPTGHETVCH